MEALVRNKKFTNLVFRKGAGFSKQEVKGAGLSWKNFRGKKDQRRKSYYEKNVETLKNLREIDGM